MKTEQALLHLINNLATKIGLRFNSNKCITMHYSNKPPAGCSETILNINGSNIPWIRDGCPAVFLGEPNGAFLPKDTVTIEYLKQRAITIMQSNLGPWKRLDCLKTFFYPSLLFIMRTDQLAKTTSIKPLIKRTLGLSPMQPMSTYMDQEMMGYSRYRWLQKTLTLLSSTGTINY